MNFCKDCNWFKFTNGLTKCMSPKLNYIEPVFGKEERRDLLCDECREDRPGRCGPGGDWFEAKEAS